MDLGQTFLIYNKCLITRSSSQIIFFKIEKQEFTERRIWVQYHSFSATGLIYYQKGNVRIQVTTDDKIYFYLMNEETLMPELENVMSNYMKCNQMMFDKKVTFCITYKANQRSFTIYKRKNDHNFKIPVVEENYEGSRCCEVQKYNMFLCTHIDKVLMYDSQEYRKLGQLDITLLAKGEDEREPNEIIAIKVSQDD